MKTQTTMEKAAAIFRKAARPPIFAAAFLVILFVADPAYIGPPWQLAFGIFALGVLPILGYPLQRFIPPFKDRGREGQRSLAMLFSFSGYAIGTIVAYIASAPARLKMIYLEYLLCGIAMLVINKAFHLKASGHACGIVGPVAMLYYFGLLIPAVIGTAIIVPVFVSSIKTKQHTYPQLIGGSAIPIAVLLILMPFFNPIL